MVDMLNSWAGQGTYGDASEPQEDGQQPRMEVRYISRLEKTERWRREFENNQAVEERLASVSRLDFAPQDYSALLIREPFQEPLIPNFDHLVDEARAATEKRYFAPIVSKVGILFALLTIAILFSNTILLGVTGAAAAVVSAMFYFNVQDRRKAIALAVAEAQEEIERRLEVERNAIEEARKQHEAEQDERISAIERLLDGDLDSIVLRLYDVFPQLGLPFGVDVNLDVYAGIPLVKIWLPSKTIIPRQTCSLANTGRIHYDDKDQRQINKQYLELCSALIIQIMSTIYAHIPTFEHGYAWGMVRDVAEDVCVIALTLNRESIAAARRATTGLQAVQLLQAVFETDTGLNLLPIRAQWPQEWEHVSPQMLRSAKFKVR